MTHGAPAWDNKNNRNRQPLGLAEQKISLIYSLPCSGVSLPGSRKEEKTLLQGIEMLWTASKAPQSDTDTGGTDCVPSLG